MSTHSFSLASLVFSSQSLRGSGVVGCGLQLTVSGWLDADPHLDECCRIFQSMVRMSYGRLLQGGGQREVELALLERYRVRDLLWRRNAIIQAKAIITGQRRFLPLQLEELDWKLQQVRKKLNHISNPQKRHGYEMRILKLQRIKTDFEAHNQARTLPRVVFGSRRRIGSEAWRRKRRGQFLSVGDAWYKGNRNTRIHRDGNTFSLEVRNSPSGSFTIPLNVPAAHRRVFEALADGQLRPLHSLKTEKGYRPYTVRVIKAVKGYRCHVTLEAPEEPIQPWGRERVVAVDMNPTHLDVAILSHDGNLIASHTFCEPSLIYARKGKRLWLASNLVEKALKWASFFHADAVIVEALLLRGVEHGPDANRLIANFMHRKMVELIASKTLRREWLLVRVPVAYSSRIAVVKYQTQYPRMSVHQLAAFVLGRRALGLQERLNVRELNAVVGRSRKQQAWVKASYLSGHRHPYLTPSTPADGRIGVQDVKGRDAFDEWVTPHTRYAVKADVMQRLSHLMPYRRGLRRVEVIRDDGWTRAQRGNAPPTVWCQHEENSDNLKRLEAHGL